MAHLTTDFSTSFRPAYAPAPRPLRLGTREITVRRDCRTRFYRVRPVIDCRPGMEPGHLEVLFFRKWLVILSGAR